MGDVSSVKVVLHDQLPGRGLPFFRTLSSVFNENTSIIK